MSKTVIIHTPAAPAPVYNRTEVVHEHRAPTDASVALLNEMQAAAEKNRISAMRVANNTFEGRVEIFRMQDQSELVAVAIFDLNGSRQRVEARTDYFDDANKLDLMIQLRDNVARRIADEILTDLLATVKI